jgi:hypothetical protein
MKVDFCIDSEEGGSRTRQFALTWEEGDVIDSGWKLPLFAGPADAAVMRLLEVPENYKRTRAYYHVSIDGRRLFAKLVDEEGCDGG